jgi:ferrochelatase
MAYGTPRRLDDVESYYTDIRGGRAPTREQLEDLTERYRAIGGRSPLFEITLAQARGIEQRAGVRAYVGQKHASPTITEAVRNMARDGVERAVGVVLAPHYSSMSVGDYERRAEKAAADLGWDGQFDVIPSWHLEPGYVQWLANALQTALESLGDAAQDAMVVFTAHSLPERIRDQGDPYPQQLRETAQAVAQRAGAEHWQVGWQSAGRTREPWLGPDVGEVIEDVAAKGAPAVVVCPCGFVADHLEILYDLDIEARRRARRSGIAFARTAVPNDDPAFLNALASVVRRRLNDME